MKSKQIKKLLSLSVLSVGVLASSVASDSSTVFASEAKNFNSNLNIEIKATTVNVTVPADAPVVFNENGTVTTPSDWSVTNNSAIAGVHITKVSVNDAAKKWRVVDGSTNLTSMPVNTKSIRLKFGKEGNLKLVAPVLGEDGFKGECSFNDKEIEIPAKQKQTLSFEIERGAFTTTESSAKAFDMELTFAFD